MGTDIRHTFLLWSMYRTIRFGTPSIFTNNTTPISTSICRYLSFLFHLTHGLSCKKRGIHTYMIAVIVSQTHFSLDYLLLCHVPYHSNLQFRICSGFRFEANVKYRLAASLFEQLHTRFSIASLIYPSLANLSLSCIRIA